MEQTVTDAEAGRADFAQFEVALDAFIMATEQEAEERMALTWAKIRKNKSHG